MKFFKRKPKEQKAKEPVIKKLKKVTPQQASYDFIKASKEFEQSRIGDIEASKKIAWRVAAGACAVACCSSVALMMLTPFKEVRPYVIRVDNNTGATDIVTMLDKDTTTHTEETAKYFSALYVSLRESYDWYTIQDQINKMMVFSDRNEQNKINTKFARPDAPHKIYADKQRVEIKVTNTSIIDGGKDAGLVQVRFVKTIKPMDGGSWNQQTQSMNPRPIITNHMATLGFEYVNVPTLDDIRLINPFGFTVKTYRVDDFVATDAENLAEPSSLPVMPVQPIPRTTQSVQGGE